MGIVNPYFNRATDHKERGEENTHHILPTSRTWQNIKQNKIKLYEAFHIPYHRIFGNLDFREKLLKIIQIDNTALNNEFKQELLKLLNETDYWYYYKNGVYLPK